MRRTLLFNQRNLKGNTSMQAQESSRFDRIKSFLEEISDRTNFTRAGRPFSYLRYGELQRKLRFRCREFATVRPASQPADDDGTAELTIVESLMFLFWINSQTLCELMSLKFIFDLFGLTLFIIIINTLFSVLPSLGFPYHFAVFDVTLICSNSFKSLCIHHHFNVVRLALFCFDKLIFVFFMQFRWYAVDWPVTVSMFLLTRD